ncbi:protein of unknown function (DU1801) [Fictibacillus enclensis]|uniref:YdhG-like domain-containing protein n=1 Tax=Fictibacillus enclensis TaxID=1017270 RepID=A0A0V8JCH1_9BACL|nr:DUF1801 domain-containing protein [Fictibacillus enclensis]KSU84552.1 hypothetical protein AS030_03120 [Fictibacillus enclensis]SCB81360.1 protein of unknown function (DU1801) [Fictibacillus enclensis]
MVTKKKSGQEEVLTFMQVLDHPLKQEIQRVREIIQDTHPELNEQIKWNAPSYCFRGEDCLTFNLHGKGFFRLIFHCGANSKEPKSMRLLVKDKTGLLEWLADDRAMVKFYDMNDVEAKGEKLGDVIQTWLQES